VGGRFRGNRAERRTSGIESGEQQGSVVRCEPARKTRAPSSSRYQVTS
jgi:hypothetical protein